jgi:hypothetical protein
MPASSASCARRMLLSQELTQRSGTFVTDIPPEQFGEKKPNFNLLLFRMGDCFRPMKPQSNPVAGFYPIDNLRIMPENSNCSSLMDDEAVEFKHAGDVREGSPDGAVDEQCRVETLSSDLCLANEKRGGALAAPPEEQKRPGWGEAASSFTSLYRFFYRGNLRAGQSTRGSHCMSVQNCTILKLSRDHDGRSTAPTPGVKAWEPKAGTGLPNVVRRSADREACPKSF